MDCFQYHKWGTLKAICAGVGWVWHARLVARDTPFNDVSGEYHGCCHWWSSLQWQQILISHCRCSYEYTRLHLWFSNYQLLDLRLGWVIHQTFPSSSLSCPAHTGSGNQTRVACIGICVLMTYFVAVRLELYNVAVPMGRVGQGKVVGFKYKLKAHGGCGAWL